MDEREKLYREHVKELERRYAAALAEAGYDAVLIHSGAPKMRSSFDDQYWPLRVTPHYQHWLALQVADSGLLVQPGRTPILYENVHRDFWEGPAAPESDHFRRALEVVELENPDLVREMLPQGLKIAYVGEDLARGAAWGIPEERRNPKALAVALDSVRVRKTPYEIHCLEEANRRAAKGHKAVLDAFRSGDHSELELHVKYLEATSQDDPETPYKNIVALGEHAATLHHIAYGRKKSPAQALLLDAGATCEGYASDITRTAVKGGEGAAGVFGGLVAKIDVMQQRLCRDAKPGTPYQDLHDRAHVMLAGVLREVGIARGSDAELVDQGVTRKFLPHGLGHSLGLQTHDVGCAVVKPEPRNPFLRNTSTITPGQVFTIEPGCYFIESLLGELEASPAGKTVDWPLVGELSKFGGVRIEDDLEVLAGGTRNMTRPYLP
jgi:Xaa-Pro dipeptidase